MKDLPLTEGPQALGGLKLRPFTLGTLEICRRVGLSMFTAGQLPEDAGERARQVSAFLFIQSEPLDEMLAAVSSTERFNDALLRFQFRLTPAILDDGVALIEKNLQGTGEMVVEIEPKPQADGAREETPPPN